MKQLQELLLFLVLTISVKCQIQIVPENPITPQPSGPRPVFRDPVPLNSIPTPSSEQDDNKQTFEDTGSIVTPLASDSNIFIILDESGQNQSQPALNFPAAQSPPSNYPQVDDNNGALSILGDPNPSVPTSQVNPQAAFPLPPNESQNVGTSGTPDVKDNFDNNQTPSADFVSRNGLGQSGNSISTVNQNFPANPIPNNAFGQSPDLNIGGEPSVSKSDGSNIRGTGNLLRDKPTNSLLDFQPKGSVYVSVQQPVQVSTSPSCSFPDSFGQDAFELSTSEFGFPKLEVEQALKNSVAETVLKVLTDIMYDGVLATQVPGRLDFSSRDFANNRLNNGYNILSGPSSDFRQLGSNSLLERNDNKLRSPSFGNLDYNSLGNSEFGKLDYFGNDVKGTGESIDSGNGGEKTSQNDGSSYSNQIPGSVNTQGSDINNESAEKRNETGNFTGVNQNGEEAKPRNRLTSNNDPIRSSSNPNPRLQTSPGGFGNFNSFSTNLFSNNLPSPSANSPGTSNIDRLFPPKASDQFLDEPPGPVGDDNANPFITYNGDQRSENVGSPFSFNRQSLFGSLPRSPFGLSGDGSASLATGDNDLTSSFGTSNFGGGATNFGSSSPAFGSGSAGFGSGPSNFGSGSASLGNGSPNFGGGSSLFSNNGNTNLNLPTAGQGDSFGSGQFAFPQRFRKKRQAGLNPVVSVNSACTPTYKVLRQYKHYASTCFVVMPEVQGIYFAECSNAQCSGCRFEGGASRCVAERVPIWVWSYCEAGPHAGKVMPDRVEVAVTCTCKTTTCHSPLPGR